MVFVYIKYSFQILFNIVAILWSEQNCPGDESIDCLIQYRSVVTKVIEVSFMNNVNIFFLRSIDQYQ